MVVYGIKQYFTSSFSHIVYKNISNGAKANTNDNDNYTYQYQTNQLWER